MYNVLGINALTVWDLAQGHSTIANNGVKNTLHMVSKVLDSNNKDMYNAPSNGTKVFDANDCALVQKAMQAPPRTVRRPAHPACWAGPSPASPVPPTTKWLRRSWGTPPA